MQSASTPSLSTREGWAEALAGLDPVHQRAIAAIIGATVADAAAQPLHWVYDSAKMHELVGDGRPPEFHTPPANPYYRLEVGKQTCYGDQAFVLLQSLVECGGLNLDDFIKRTDAFFGPGTAYDTGLSGPPPMDQLPLPAGKSWIHASIRKFRTNFELGKPYPEVGSDDKQIDCVAKIAPVVALYAGTDELLCRAEEAIRTTQNTEEAVGYGLAAARILESIIMGHCSPAEAVQECIKALRDPKRKFPNDIDRNVAASLKKVVEMRAKPHSQVVATLGKG
jgi:hypothetical protein